MKIDTLRSFLMLADEKSMTSASKRLHISQPTLSRQMKALEDDLEKQLYTREDGIIKLTHDGHILYEYALSITELESRARYDIANCGERITGTVYIGYGDSNAMTYVLQAISDVHARHEQVKFNLISGDTKMLIERLEHGLIDFMMECGVKTRGRYHSLSIPGQDTIAVLVNKGNRLYGKEKVTPNDLEGEDLIVSKQFFQSSSLREWAGNSYAKLNPVVFFNLGMGVFDLAEFGMGCVIVYQELAERRCGRQMQAIPLHPPLFDKSGIVWRKKRTLSSAATFFIDTLRAHTE